jgi:hypothetical protein
LALPLRGLAKKLKTRNSSAAVDFSAISYYHIDVMALFMLMAAVVVGHASSVPVAARVFGQGECETG